MHCNNIAMRLAIVFRMPGNQHAQHDHTSHTSFSSAGQRFFRFFPRLFFHLFFFCRPPSFSRIFTFRRFLELFKNAFTLACFLNHSNNTPGLPVLHPGLLFLLPRNPKFVTYQTLLKMFGEYMENVLII